MFNKLPERYHGLARSMRANLMNRVALQGSKPLRYAVLYSMSWERLCRGVRRKGATTLII